MSSRLAVAAITAALSLVACGPTPPPTAPAATGQAASTSPAQSPSALPSASPDGTLPVDDAAYLAGDPFTLSVGEDGTDWTAPSRVPVMPNGQQAARVTFLPASCGTGNFTITADAAPEDTWETDLRADGNYALGSWPAAQVPECANGPVRTYLQVAYHPFAAFETVRLVASLTNVNDAPAAVEVVPVFTSADASQPAFTMAGSTAFNGTSGPEKPRSAKAQELSVERFAAATLPDGTTPTQWGFVVTGCGLVGHKPIVITARVGDAPPVDVGSCSDGSFLSAEMSLPIPAEGTEIAVLMAGGTTKSQVRISEFQWRGDRH